MTSDAEADVAHPRPGLDEETGLAPWPRVVWCVVACAAFGAIDGLHVVALLCGYGIWLEVDRIGQMLPGFELRDLPVPTHALPMHEWLMRGSRLGTEPWLLAATVGSGLVAGAALIAVMHPFLLRALRRGIFGPYKIMLAAVLTVVGLVLAFWPLSEEVMRTHFPFTRAALAGGMLLLLWHRRGWLHADANWPSYVTLGLRFATGALLGVLGAALLGHRPHPSDYLLVSHWFGAGLYNSEAWRAVTAYTIAVRAWYGLVLGGLAVVLAPTALPPARRLRTALVVLLGCAASRACFEPWQRSWVQRHDVGRPLASAVAEIDARPPDRAQWVVLLSGARPDRPLRKVIAPAASVSGLPFDPRVTAAMQALTAADRKVSALARDAAIHLHDEASWRWSQPDLLRLQLAQLRSPSATPAFAAVLAETVSLTADTPRARAVMDALLDPEEFVWPTPESTELLAQLAWRWGRLDQVRDRVRARRPDLLERFEGVTPPGCRTELRGRLLLDGQPLGKVRVGLIAPLDSIALQAEKLLPWPQRRVVVAVETDAGGRFRIAGAVEGMYRLLAALPDDRYHLTDLDLHCPVPLRRVMLVPGRLVQDLGTIELRSHSNSRGTQGA